MNRKCMLCLEASANFFMTALEEEFGKQLVTQGLQPPASPNSHLWNYYLWGTKMQEHAYALHSLQELIT
jgi:hypothetical protein